MAFALSIDRRFYSSRRALRSAINSTIRPIHQHRFSLYDLQYLFLFLLFSFCYWIMDKPTWFKLPIVITTLLLLIPRKTRQFLLPFFAIAAWLLLFYCCRFIPSEWRPHIFTSVLPTLENILYGGSISEMLASTTSPFKDILAWIPYGVLHYVLPIVVAILIIYFGPSGTLPVYARTFGYMNVAGVLTQIFFPCAPPWYETRYGGFQPAVYTMPGDPGGLARVDDILGVQMYKTTFTASPLVFGAFPSLHSADACLLAFFVVYVFGPRSIPFAMSYVFWIWWATMYLGHHYVVDLVGGGAYAVIAFWIGSFFLPSVLPTQQEEYDEYDEYDEDDGDLKYGQYYSDRKGQSSVKIDMIEALRQHEKRTLLCTPDDQDNEGDDESEAGSSSDCGSRSGCNNSASDVRFVDEGVIVAMDESLEMSRVVVDISTAGVGVGTLSTLKIKEARRVRSEGSSPSSPSSPTSMSSSSYSSSSSSSSAAASSSSRKIKKSSSNTSRQSWNGWQGYESWIEVLATVNTPRTSPKTSPVPSASSSSTNLPGVTY